MAMRDVIYDAIVKGGATNESLLALTGTTKKGLASQFTYLRMMGKCPQRQEDGTYKIVSAEEWEASKASGGTAGKILTPAERAEKAAAREKRASTALTNAEKRLEANPDDVLAGLQKQKCEIELQISSILLSQAEKAAAEAEPEEASKEEASKEELDEGGSGFEDTVEDDLE